VPSGAGLVRGDSCTATPGMEVGAGKEAAKGVGMLGSGPQVRAEGDRSAGQSSAGASTANAANSTLAESTAIASQAGHPLAKPPRPTSGMQHKDHAQKQNQEWRRSLVKPVLPLP